MSKPAQINPTKGGSYERDAVTGKLVRTHKTLPALTAQEILDGVYYDDNLTKQEAKKPAPVQVAAAVAPATTEAKKR